MSEDTKKISVFRCWPWDHEWGNPIVTAWGFDQYVSVMCVRCCKIKKRKIIRFLSNGDVEDLLKDRKKKRHDDSCG